MENLLTIAISAPVQLSSTQNTASVKVNTGAGLVTTIQPQVAKTESKVTITPAPVVQVNAAPEDNEPILESLILKLLSNLPILIIWINKTCLKRRLLIKSHKKYKG